MRSGLRWFRGKRLLSSVRGSDYAHAGEDEAIVKCLSPFPKDPNRLILDAGCGQGGTADFIQRNGWGKVTGFDIEEESIAYAKHTYPGIEFLTADVANVSETLQGRKFDLICLFNAFYAFQNQLEALQNLHKLAKNDAELVIFDYTDITLNGNNPMIIKDDFQHIFMPIRSDTIYELMDQSRWECTSIKDLTAEYERWYQNLLRMLLEQKEKLVADFTEEEYLHAVERYTRLCNAIKGGSLGGCVLYARKV